MLIAWLTVPKFRNDFEVRFRLTLADVTAAKMWFALSILYILLQMLTYVNGFTPGMLYQSKCYLISINNRYDENKGFLNVVIKFFKQHNNKKLVWIYFSV